MAAQYLPTNVQFHIPEEVGFLLTTARTSTRMRIAFLKGVFVHFCCMPPGVSCILFPRYVALLFRKPACDVTSMTATMHRETMKETFCKCLVQNVTRRCQW